MIKNKKSIIVYIAIIILVVVLVLVSFFMPNEKPKETTSKKSEFKIKEMNIEEREVMNINESIYIGENKKQIENDYYDVKIVNNGNSIDIYLNKLWYKNDLNELIDTNYLQSIIREITKNLKITNNKEEFEYMLFNYIKDNYNDVKKGDVCEKIYLENMEISMEEYDKMAKLVIKGV